MTTKSMATRLTVPVQRFSARFHLKGRLLFSCNPCRTILRSLELVMGPRRRGSTGMGMVNARAQLGICTSVAIACSVCEDSLQSSRYAHCIYIHSTTSCIQFDRTAIQAVLNALRLEEVNAQAAAWRSEQQFSKGLLERYLKSNSTTLAASRIITFILRSTKQLFVKKQSVAWEELNGVTWYLVVTFQVSWEVYCFERAFVLLMTFQMRKEPKRCNSQPGQWFWSLNCLAYSEARAMMSWMDVLAKRCLEAIPSGPRAEELEMLLFCIIFDGKNQMWIQQELKTQSH